MSEIKPGDLFMVVKPMQCCGFAGGLGYVGKCVSGIVYPRSVCVRCGDSSDNQGDEIGYMLGGDFFLIERSRVIKIDPPAEMKDTETTKELTV